MAQMVSPQMMILPAAAANPSAKDSRWLTLEVCREFQRSKCSRTDTECKFAHPPPHVEVQNGRVVACFDSIKGKCQRKDPPCKYLHPPQHLREQLLQNGRNNLILKNMQLQAYQHHMAAGVLPVTGAKTMAAMTTVLPGGQYSYLNPYALPVAAPNPASPYNPYITTSVPPSHSVAMTTNGDANSPIISQAIPHMIPAAPKAVRADKFEAQTVQENGEGLTSTHTHLVDPLTFPTTYFTQVCREFQRGTCSRPQSECRYAHPATHMAVDACDNHVTVCMDFIKNKCTRDACKYFHPPAHLQALVRDAAHHHHYAPICQQAFSSSNTTSTSSSSSSSSPTTTTTTTNLVNWFRFINPNNPSSSSPLPQYSSDGSCCSSSSPPPPLLPPPPPPSSYSSYYSHSLLVGNLACKEESVLYCWKDPPKIWIPLTH